MKKKKIDFLITVLLLALGATATFYLKPTNPIFGLLYLGIPSFFLILRKKKNYKKIGWGVFVFGVLLGSVLDLVAKINGAWIVDRLIFPKAVIGTWPVETLAGYIWMALFILVFYEHFLDDEKNKRLSKKHSRIFLILLVIVFLVFVSYFANLFPLTFPYFYLKIGLAAIVFPIIFAFYNPQVIKKFAPLAFFFFFVWLVAEFVGIHNQNWIFTPRGEFVGYVSVLGVSFPFEEVFFWMVWYPAVVVAYYEYFIDDGK